MSTKRFDVVGSFLRTETLKKARSDFESGIITKEQFTSIKKEEVKKLVDEVVILLLLEQLNDYIRLLTQIMDCLNRFSIGITLNGIDDVNYADIIPEKKTPDEQ